MSNRGKFTLGGGIMGYVTFIKIYEDEFCVIYSYSHDCDLHDGRIEIKKGGCDLQNLDNWKEECVELTISKTDETGLFAIKALLFLARICSNPYNSFPDKHMLAYG